MLTLLRYCLWSDTRLTTITNYFLCRAPDSRGTDLAIEHCLLLRTNDWPFGCNRLLNIIAVAPWRPNSWRRKQPRQRLEMRLKTLRKVGLSLPSKDKQQNDQADKNR